MPLPRLPYRLKVGMHDPSLPVQGATTGRAMSTISRLRGFRSLRPLRQLIPLLFKKCHLHGWETAFTALKVQLHDYDAWVRTNLRA